MSLDNRPEDWLPEDEDALGLGSYDYDYDFFAPYLVDMSVYNFEDEDEGEYYFWGIGHDLS